MQIEWIIGTLYKKNTASFIDIKSGQELPLCYFCNKNKDFTALTKREYYNTIENKVLWKVIMREYHPENF